ncbi:trigger factor [Methylophilaceae bacterium 11]|uniref:trigger factor n=1 Tax=Methylotenera sp. 1P/1 TaxID=1131551 RepID=UPI00035C4C84|nr:trigger factor [Methylotenera sp. 1P/1]EUJ10543.1 trigger factor [Methylophilaceae bacterium 11]
MAVSVEKISNLERRMTISVPLAPLEGQIRQRLSQISRTAKFAGFRPGKAPIGLVNQHYGDQVRDEVYSKAVETSFGDAVEENKLRVAGFPNIEHKPFAEAAQDFEYTATFEVLPEIQLKDLSKVKIEQPALEVADADVEKTLDVLVKQRVTFEPVKRAAKKGDRINIALIASIDGKEVERTADNGIDLVVGEPGRMADFDDALLGGKAGATKTFEIAYPADHNPAQLAGKTVSYEVTFNTVSQPVLPPVDAEFAKSLGVEDGNIDTMKTEIKASLTQEVEKRVKARVKEAVFQALIAEAEFEAPKAIVGSEINRLMQVTAQNLQQRGMDPKAIQLEPAMFEEQAKRNAALRLILAEVVNTNNLQATPDQIRAMVDTFAQSFEKPAELVSWYYADVKRLDEPAALATEENVVNWVLNQAKVTNKKIKFDELMAGA